jgi:DNA (cytosine-5)-methyltransferase 1
MKRLRVLDLFSGIGGFSLGLEQTGGFETVAFCEIEEFPRKVLAKHWPDVPCFHDVRKLTRADIDGAVDVICGGFPCQDISLAGKGAGIEGDRSGLWSEYARLIGEFRPRFVIVENVTALLGRGLGRVLGDLAALGYDAEWHCIPASAIGAPHRRDRVWVLAYSNSFNAQGIVTRCNDTIVGKEQIERQARLCSGAGQFQNWSVEPAVGRVAHGIPDRVGQLKALGNAVVPQIPELIGHAILEAERTFA